MKSHGSKIARILAAVCVVAGSQFAAAPLAVSGDAPGVFRMSDLNPQARRAASAPTIRAQSPNDVERTCFLTSEKSNVGGCGECASQCCASGQCCTPGQCCTSAPGSACADGCNGGSNAGPGSSDNTLLGRMFGGGKGRGSRNSGCLCGNPGCQCSGAGRNGGWGSGANGYAANGGWGATGSDADDWDDDCDDGSGGRGRTLCDALFGCLSPSGICCQGAPPIGKYSITYANNPSYADARDGQAWAAQGYGMPLTVPIAPVVRYTYNYSHGTPASRLTPTSTYNPMTSPHELYHQSW